MPSRKLIAEALPWTLATVALGGFALVLYRTAWLSDDAYVTFRAIDNWIEGHGLRWNANERVQTYTNPLWMLAVAGAAFFTREFYLTPILLAMAVSMAAAGLLAFRVARAGGAAVFAVAALMGSRAFVDYSTSGLENPLTHLLLAAFAIALFHWQWSPRVLFLLSLAAGLSMLNRMDTILFYAPALAYAWISQRTWRATIALAAGFLPFAAWELFSLVYYGFLVPNTAFAKLGTGMDGATLARQGLHYFAYTWRNDPATLPLIALGVATSFLSRRGREAALGLGVLLYLAYVVRIGGDFMGGRFFAAPFFAAVILLARLPFPRRAWTALPAAALLLWLSTTAPHAPILSGAAFGESVRGFADVNGVGDERRYYYQSSGLLHWRPDVEMPTHKYANEGRAYGERPPADARPHGAIGFRGFFAGPETHIIDYYALCDPLLARLPARYIPRWRIGHFTRYIPPGYLESAVDGVNRIKDPEVAALFDQVLLITRGPLWSGERWAAIAAMNLGTRRFNLDTDQLRFPRMKRSSADKIAMSTPAANAAGTKFSGGGIGVRLPGRSQSARFEASLRGPACRLLVMDGTEVVGDFALPAPERGRAWQIHTVTLPRRIAEAGYTELRFIPVSGRDEYALGHLALLGR